MSCLIERKAQIIFVTASLVQENGKKRRVVIESRPEFALVKLKGSRQQFPIAWELVYDKAKRHQTENLRLEALAKRPSKRYKAKESR